MRIDRLPQECIERLSRLLENGTSVDWKVLATEGFPSIYSDPKKLARIESSPRPASGLLHDLCFRGESVETLLRALNKIGNARAVSVIIEEVPELGKNRVDREISPPPGIRSMQPEENHDITEQSETLPRPIQEAGIGNRTPSSHPNYDTEEQSETLRRPVQEARIENRTPSSHPVSNTSFIDLSYDTKEQSETLRRPIQETKIGNRTPSSHPLRNTLLMDLISAMFPCFGHFNRFY